MAEMKNINMYLMDGNVNGRIKCTCFNWTGVVFKIPRTALAACKDRAELNQSGVYLLFGKDDDTDKGIVYVGQAGNRKNGEGILNRLREHDHSIDKGYWTESIVITTSNDSLGATEISYLENQFCQAADSAKRYDVKNKNEPFIGNLSEEKKSDLDDFINYAKVIVGMLGHKVFEPLISTKIQVASENIEFYFTKRSANAVGVRTADGFVVKSGSLITSSLTDKCPEHIKRKRDEYKNKIDQNYKLIEDILFNTPSGAACFVSGASLNGLIEWKTKEGKNIKDIDAELGSAR